MLAAFKASMNASGTAEKAAAGKESLQLIDGSGKFDETGLEAFVKHTKLASFGLSYAVVAIMGPQSSGKSTLMNHLFKTSFAEMDAFAGRSQTTQGVWIARAAGIDPCTIVMDLEGTDGRERGEDDTTFEKQSALFALAVSDIVLINMWCHDIGREQAANKPLLKIVFQVMMRLFTPRKTTLLFVIRDKTRTPMEVLEPILREDVQKIWESAPKPPNFEGIELSECFNVQVTALASYEDKLEVFKDQVADLRERFTNSIAPGGIAGDRRAVVPGTGFPVSIKSFWKIIKENKDLDLPAHKVMVATVRCEEIAREKLTEFLQNQDWIDLKESAAGGAVLGFGTKCGVLLDKYISEYDEEVAYFDASVRTSKRTYLLTEALQAVYPSYQSVVAHHRTGVFEKFKQDLKNGFDSPVGEADGFALAVRQLTKLAVDEFDKDAADSEVSHSQWDVSKVRDKLCRDIDAHAALIRGERIGSIVKAAEDHFEQMVREPTGALLDAATRDTWSAIRELLAHETHNAHLALLSSLSGYEMDEQEKTSKLEALTEFGRTVVESEAKKEATQALLRMKDRFSTSFSHDADAMPRLWADTDDVRKIARDARSASLKGLSILAAIRLDITSFDHIEQALCTLLDDAREGTLSKTTSLTPDGESSSKAVSNPFAASGWDGVAEHNTLLTPVQCKNIWRQFKAETDYTITQALTAQELNRSGRSWLPPPWAIAAMVLLGFNEFVALLRNPLYILIFLVVYLLGKVVWVQFDVGNEFRHGIMPGLLSVTSKIIPTFNNYMTKLSEGSSVGGSSVRGAHLARNNSASTNPLDNAEMLNFAQDSDFSSVTDDDGSVRNRRSRKTVELAN